jgi:hypothetical protein
LGRLAVEYSRQLGVLAIAISLAACGGSSSDDSSQANRAPAANAGSDQNAAELTTVNLSGSGTDPDNDTLTYAWTQTGGTNNVTLTSANSASASFTAPDVTAGVPDVLSFQLTVTDPSGLADSDTVTVTIQEPAPVVTISGTLRYEFPPPNAQCRGLDFGNLQTRPIRQATVQMLDSTGLTLLDSTLSDENGAYSLTVNSSTDVMIRVRAELLGSNWNVEVRNNVDNSGSPPPLQQRPIYAMDSTVFDSGVTNQTRNLTAATGFSGGVYNGARVAAPFAILDTIYSAMQFVVAEDPNVSFAPLDAFWSPDNKTASPENIAQGDLQTTYYDGGLDSLFLLGQASTDTDEFDDHVVIHEWGHYFEDTLSRSDSFGGSHGNGDLLDIRTAFGEGWASALAAMSLGDPLYCDTATVNSGGGFNSESTPGGFDGWFNEQTIIRLIYDLWDTDDDGVDNDSIGFGPIYDVMTGPQSSTGAFTSIFTFATYLKQQNTGKDAFIDALLTDADINPAGIDIWGSTETNDGPNTPDDVLPVYTDLTFGGAAVNICVNSQFDNGRDGNKLSENRYLRMNLPSNSVVSFSMVANPAPSQPSPGFDCTADPDDPENSQHSDPDFLVMSAGNYYVLGWSCEPNAETQTTQGFLVAGEYIIDIEDARHADEDSPGNYPEQVCFDVSAN